MILVMGYSISTLFVTREAEKLVIYFLLHGSSPRAKDVDGSPIVG